MTDLYSGYQKIHHHYHLLHPSENQLHSCPKQKQKIIHQSCENFSWKGL